MAVNPRSPNAVAAPAQRIGAVGGRTVDMGVNRTGRPTLRWRIEAPAPFEAPAAKASRPDEGSWSERDGSVA